MIHVVCEVLLVYYKTISNMEVFCEVVSLLYLVEGAHYRRLQMSFHFPYMTVLVL